MSNARARPHSRALATIAVAVATALLLTLVVPRAERDLPTRAALAHGTQILAGDTGRDSFPASPVLLARLETWGGWRAIDAASIGAAALALLCLALAQAAPIHRANPAVLTLLILAPAFLRLEPPLSASILALAALGAAVLVSRSFPRCAPLFLGAAGFLWAELGSDAPQFAALGALIFQPAHPGKLRYPRALRWTTFVAALAGAALGPLGLRMFADAGTRHRAEWTDGVWCWEQAPPALVTAFALVSGLWVALMFFGGRTGRIRTLLTGVLCLAPAAADARHLPATGLVLLPLLLPRLEIAVRLLLRRRVRSWAAILALAALVATVLLALLQIPAFAPARFRPVDARILDPTVLLRGSASQPIRAPVYASARARVYLLLDAPSLLAPADRSARGDALADIDGAPVDLALWEKLNRARRYQAVLLAGPTLSIAPLARHLLGSTDWTLTWLDQSAILFVRADIRLPKWTSDRVAPLMEAMARLPRTSAAHGLLQLGRHLAAVDLGDDARASLDQSARLMPGLPASHLELASIEAGARRWDDALRHLDRCLRLTPRAPEALYAQAQILAALGRWAQAYHSVGRLLARSPDDPRHLLLGARVAHAVHDTAAELRHLRRLLRVARERRLPAGAYHMLHAQALLREGDSAQALAEYSVALRAPEVSAEEKAVVRENVARLRAHLERERGGTDR